MRNVLLLAVGLVVCAACGGATDAPPAVASETFATGRSCAVASGACEAGRCVVEVDNRCSTPITCNLRAESVCKSPNGDTGKATGTTGKATQLGGTKKALEATVDCGDGAPVLTTV